MFLVLFEYVFMFFVSMTVCIYMSNSHKIYFRIYDHLTVSLPIFPSPIGCSRLGFINAFALLVCAGSLAHQVESRFLDMESKLLFNYKNIIARLNEDLESNFGIYWCEWRIVLRKELSNLLQINLLLFPLFIWGRTM